ncbi:MAG: hypothetical protein GY859_19220 [Desulfobacterales bacterium]|nr:hypothetical protein [Desulfobacterales bacterium]
MEFLVDFIRQMVNSRQMHYNFNLCQGTLFIDHFEKLFSARRTRGAMNALERLFPNIQFIIGCNTKSGVERIASHGQKTLPVESPVEHVKKFMKAKSTSDRKTWDYRNNFLKSRFKNTDPAGEDDVVLIDVDSLTPNLALMKLSAHYKKQGRNVILARDSRHCRKSKIVFASCIFNRVINRSKLKKLRNIHGENIRIGGTGVDLSLTLPDEVEKSTPDYSLYPNVDFGLGFLSRGCPGNCGFCIVPKKEGGLRQVAEIDDILPPGFDKLVLMDNNVLALPGAGKILKEMIKRKLRVNFNQSLDIRVIDKRTANLLLKVDSKNYSFTKRMYYFALNSADMIPVFKKKIELFDSLKSGQIRILCMFGYNTTLSDDLARFSYLSRNGMSPFVQRYQPTLGAVQPEIRDFFDTDIEPLLAIRYAQNGRIFENYLKWVSKKYVERYGKLHMPLVDLIFKYNNRHTRHRYIETLAGTRKAG